MCSLWNGVSHRLLWGWETRTCTQRTPSMKEACCYGLNCVPEKICWSPSPQGSRKCLCLEMRSLLMWLVKLTWSHTGIGWGSNLTWCALMRRWPREDTETQGGRAPCDMEERLEWHIHSPKNTKDCQPSLGAGKKVWNRFSLRNLRTQPDFHSLISDF